MRKKGRSVRSFLHVRAVDDIIDAIFDVLKSYATLWTFASIEATVD